MNSQQLIFAAIVVAATFSFSSSLKPELSETRSTDVVGTEEYRLPNNTVPLHYDLKLIPELENGTLRGEVDIDVTVNEATSTIIFHAYQIEITSAIVTSANVAHTITRRTYNEDLQFYTLTFGTTLVPGNYSIHVEYTGLLHDDFRGFYRGAYQTASGETRWYAHSFFAPVHARRAFPCFDEPALKAEFTISIAHFSNYSAISNAMIESVSTANSTIGNRVWTRFYTTPVMSTYLVAFLVSDFEHVSNTDGNFSIWSRPEAIATAHYSLAGVSLLDELSRFTGINYNSLLPKMDQVAVPTKAATAMEDWGLIAYRERWLLWQEGVSTSRDEQNIVGVGTHEFAHQWFGNLVTPAWWKYVWLSEGFATFFEFYTAAQIKPSWRLMEQLQVEVCHAALLSDSLETSHPINQDAYTPDEINAKFDIVTYNKGACLIWMLFNFIGEPVLQAGLQSYLANNLYGTGTPDQLWQSLTAADNNTSNSILPLHVDIGTVMDTWTNQKGYPLVTVTRNYTSATQEISQERFLLNGRGSSNDTTEYRWWIPINFASQTSPTFDVTRSNNWIRAQDESVIISGFQPTDWIIFNVLQTGFYRVNYDEENWRLLAEYLQTSNFTDIPATNRAQLIDDAFNLARAGYLDYTVALRLIRYMTQETDYIPWSAAFRAYDFLTRMLARSAGATNLRNYLFSRVAPIHNSLGYEVQDTDDHVTNFLRAQSHNWACRFACPGCNSQSQQLIQNFYNSGGNSSIPVDLRGWAYCAGLRHASIDVWNFMWGRYLASDVAGEQALILSGLGCSLNEDILNRYLNFSITENSGVRTYDRVSVFTSVILGNTGNVDVTLAFLLNNINAASVAYGGTSIVGSLLEALAARLVSETQLTSLKEYISEHGDQLGDVAAAAERAVKIAEENIAWLNRYETDITQWLAAESSAAGIFITCGPVFLIFVYAILNSMA